MGNCGFFHPTYRGYNSYLEPDGQPVFMVGYQLDDEPTKMEKWMDGNGDFHPSIKKLVVLEFQASFFLWAFRVQS